MSELVYGQYALGKLIGTGGMGRVYKAVDTALQREVAVKVLSSKVVEAPETLERFRSEARTLGKLSHPNIASVYNFIEVNGEYLLVMELVTGDTLEDLVKRDGPVSPKKASELICQALQGLEHAHSKNIIHRDIKPSNLMVTEEGVVKLMDFGIAKMTEGPKLTREGKAPGTPEYMSPEQIQGMQLDARSDLYSMGVVLFELLTGDVPFHGDTDFELMRAHIDIQAPSIHSPSTAGVDLDRIIQKSLSKTVAKRYASAALMRAELSKIAQASEDTSFGATVASLLRRASWQARNNSGIVFSLMALAAVAIIVGIAAPNLRAVAGASAIFLSALVVSLCGRAHWLAAPVGGSSLACGLALLGFGFFAPSNSPPTVVQPAPVPVAKAASAGSKDDSSGNLVAEAALQQKTQELKDSQDALNAQQKEAAKQAAQNRIDKMLTDAESDCTTANNEHDNFGLTKTHSEREQHRNASIAAAKDGLRLAGQVLDESAQDQVELSPDDKGKLLYNMALMQWYADQPYADSVGKAQDVVPLMQDPTKIKDCKMGIQFLKQVQKAHGNAWTVKGGKLFSSRVLKGTRLA